MSEGYEVPPGVTVSPDDLVAMGARKAVEQMAIRPIPLSERKPGPGDRDHYGQCWWWRTSFTHRPAWVYASGWGTHWLPSTAQFLPARVEG